MSLCMQLATSKVLPLSPGGSRGFKPAYTFLQGKVQFTTTFSKTVAKSPVSGSFGINGTDLSLFSVKSATSCNLNLKKDKASGVANFNLLCRNWRLPPAVGGQPDLVSTIAFKQATGKGAVSIQATGALTSARIF
ncbi:hypothetical protein MNEG_11261 [Monoraphidium neglectum]|uniref:Uncharacterized protein n=1 Tax=Monoraphidium neglectum TaxID=145388 RepID=A0A0D2LZ95_9CHLO|nr:hypothetical protein MNEG_11261 [Monoraphidium neglectum]KIY96699.1 hypothetical protein MNEG_11261 [Monoraphidium neglectum]|eukprot:XP_013895719.1 hypothetical protein MNEG_11261 [Monoraphidium neglectum]